MMKLKSFLLIVLLILNYLNIMIFFLIGWNKEYNINVSFRDWMFFYLLKGVLWNGKFYIKCWFLF